ncbi:hypothetical protein FRD01_22785 [Microvenator marinus]|uniref:pectate lyase n=1 Tax=Microvenator marinus TaxID=2600177 RepID=A0A5B8XXU0_9DELT|nr:hypothetical protein [Microvenator marinus]QED30007.1 hypothetical protein FRD01_22785 [Microvenator marinus]
MRSSLHFGSICLVLILGFLSSCGSSSTSDPEDLGGIEDMGGVEDLRSADMSADLDLVNNLVDSGAADDSGPDLVTMPDMTQRPPHEQLLSELVGFGQETTGGAGGPVVTVTTLADSGAGSLREAATSQGPAWIRFLVSGVIELESAIEVLSDKTIDGRGADITITGEGLFVQNGEGNVIINNIKIRDTSNDMIRFFNGGSNMWVHKCDLSNGGDGAFDATEGVTGVTVSYTHIFDHDKAMLVGAGSDDGDGVNMRWTAHHNWYENVVQRLPAIRFGQAHSFNNLIEWRSGTAMSTRLSPSQILVENNILAPQTNVGHKVISLAEDRGAAKFVGNLERPLPGDTIEFEETNPESVFDPSTSYSYTAEPANGDLDAYIRANAGWQDVPFPEVP